MYKTTNKFVTKIFRVTSILLSKSLGNLATPRKHLLKLKVTLFLVGDPSSYEDQCCLLTRMVPKIHDLEHM